MASLAFWPIAGYMFYPTYLITNAAICDRLGSNYLAGFGLGSLTLGIMVVSIGIGWSLALSTLVA